MQIEKIMTESVHTVAPTITLGELRKVFADVSYHHLLVVEHNRLVGVISDRDVLRMSSPALDGGFDGDEMSPQDQALLQRQAVDFMATRLVTARPDTLIDTAAILLLENNISCLPVVGEQTTVAGIVTWKDMLKYYVYIR